MGYFMKKKMKEKETTITKRYTPSTQKLFNKCAWAKS